MQTNITGSAGNASNQNAPSPLVLTAEESHGLSLPDGQYTGSIKSIEARSADVVDGGVTKQVVYADFHVAVDGQDGTLKVGYPARITPRSDLGALLTVFGIPMPKPGVQVDISAIFTGRKVAFLVRNEQNADGTFSRIVKGSLRPTA